MAAKQSNTWGNFLMSQYGWSNCPQDVRDQLNHFAAEMSTILGDNLIGVYLHGSLAMGCFNPARSDLDLLAVTNEGMTLDVKRRIAETVLRTSLNPIKMELSFIVESDMHPWQYPTPFDFHFSEEWREKISSELANGTWQTWNDQRPKDSDLAAHVTIMNHCGICLVGKPIEEVFPPVPRADYIDSIMEDFDFAANLLADNPVYAILNFCRIYWYLLENRITSKDEAGAWGIENLPPEYRPLIERALKLYRGDIADVEFDASDTTNFMIYMKDSTKNLL
jgi:predicted nucleotidyltransferase